jgi:two-component system sensor histidine kinase VanS
MDSVPTVDIRLIEDSDAGFTFSVFNSGSRIPDQELHKVFDPFYRLGESKRRNSGGSGLGLFLVKNIFELLSIEYSIENLPEGVLFRANFKKFED